MTVPIYFLTNSGWSFIASEIEQKIIPFSARVSLKVVATDTESTTMSTATPESFFLLFDRNSQLFEGFQQFWINLI